jgi:hypothetical protein
MEAVGPGIQWSSGSGLATYLTYFKGLALQGLENENGFGLNVVTNAPFNSVPPSISGTLVAGNELTADPGTWWYNPSNTFEYQWQVDNAGSWEDVTDEDEVSFTPASAGTYRVAVTATNDIGSTTAFSASVVVDPA